MNTLSKKLTAGACAHHKMVRGGNYSHTGVSGEGRHTSHPRRYPDSSPPCAHTSLTQLRNAAGKGARVPTVEGTEMTGPKLEREQARRWREDALDSTAL